MNANFKHYLIEDINNIKRFLFLSISTIFLVIVYIAEVPLSNDNSDYLSGKIKFYRNYNQTLHLKVETNNCIIKNEYIHEIKRNDKYISNGDKIELYYFKWHGQYFVSELKVNDIIYQEFSWLNYTYPYLLFMLFIIFLWVKVIYKTYRYYKKGETISPFFYKKFKKLGIKRGSTAIIPNTDIIANLLYSKKNCYMVFDYNFSYILSATRWKANDNVYYNFKFDFLDDSFSKDKINIIRKKMEKYQKYLVDLSSELPEFE